MKLKTKHKVQAVQSVIKEAHLIIKNKYMDLTKRLKQNTIETADYRMKVTMNLESLQEKMKEKEAEICWMKQK